MARNMYGATSADFAMTPSGQVVPGATVTIWSARAGGVQITDLLDVDSNPVSTVTAGADGAVIYYGPNNDKTVHWADARQGSRIAIRPTDITGDPPVLSIGTVTTGAAGATLTGPSETPVLNLTLPSAGANGVNTAALQDGSVTPAKLATSGRFLFPAGATGGWGFTGGALDLSGTGSPEGVVTAVPGSEFLQTDSTTDVKGWLRWVKASGTGNTGWQVGADADTGVRRIALDPTYGPNAYGHFGGVNGAAFNADLICLRRIGGVVFVFSTGALQPKQNYSASTNTLFRLPVGFRPYGFTAATVSRYGNNGSDPGMRLVQILWGVDYADPCLVKVIPLLDSNWNNLSGGTVWPQAYGGVWMPSVSFSTKDPWPTTLPGT